MPITQFADGPAQAGILCTKETSDILLHFTATHKPKLCFPITCRKGPIIEVCRRFQSVERVNTRYSPVPGKSAAIQFSVDKRIHIYGLGLYGTSGLGSCIYTIYLGEVQASHKYWADGTAGTLRFDFENPIPIEPNVFYTAGFVMDGGTPGYFGMKGFSEVTVSGVRFKFQNDPGTKLTNVNQGQIPEIHFSPPIL